MSTRHQENIPSRQYHRAMERKPFPSETQERFIVRFPDGMRDRIADAAKANNRSMNSEIVARLQASFERSLLSSEDIDAIKQTAAIVHAPGTPEFDSTVQTFSEEIELMAQKKISESVSSLMRMAKISIESPDLFEKMLNSAKDQK